MNSSIADIGLSRDVLSLVWQRIAQMNRRERQIMIRYLESIPYTNEISNGNASNTRSNHLNTTYSLIIQNTNPQQENESINFDHNHYPIAIDWKEMEDKRAVLYDIYRNYGRFGACLMSSLSSINGLRLRALTFLSNIACYFVSILESKNKLREFIEKIPEMENLQIIIENNYFSQKELPLIKLVLEIYRKYYSLNDDLFSSTIRKKYIPLCRMFYMTLRDEDAQYIYHSFINNKKLSSELQKVGITCFYESKQLYLDDLSQLNNKYIMLLNGVDEDKFLL